jgi:hypothetical protein
MSEEVVYQDLMSIATTLVLQVSDRLNRSIRCKTTTADAPGEKIHNWKLPKGTGFLGVEANHIFIIFNRPNSTQVIQQRVYIHDTEMPAKLLTLVQELRALEHEWTQVQAAVMLSSFF